MKRPSIARRSRAARGRHRVLASSQTRSFAHLAACLRHCRGGIKAYCTDDPSAPGIEHHREVEEPGLWGLAWGPSPASNAGPAPRSTSVAGSRGSAACRVACSRSPIYVFTRPIGLFTMDRSWCSPCADPSVHVGPIWVFTFDRNPQYEDNIRKKNSKKKRK